MWASMLKPELLNTHTYLDSGCHNRIPPNMQFINHNISFLEALEAGKFKVRV